MPGRLKKTGLAATAYREEICEVRANGAARLCLAQNCDVYISTVGKFDHAGEIDAP
jgi:hypothetical protein